MSFVKCQVVEINGDRHWQAVEFIADNGKSSYFDGGPSETVYSILRNGMVVDHRETKFFQERGVLPGSAISPCPGCGCENDRHIPSAHIECWYPGLRGLPEVHVNNRGTKFVRKNTIYDQP